MTQLGLEKGPLKNKQVVYGKDVIGFKLASPLQLLPRNLEDGHGPQGGLFCVVQ